MYYELGGFSHSELPPGVRSVFRHCAVCYAELRSIPYC